MVGDAAGLTGILRTERHDEVFARGLEILGRAQDIAMGISRDGESRGVLRGLTRARERGMLTVGLAGGDGGRLDGAAEFVFVVPSDDPLVVQEVHETLYHVLWELVHLFFEHRVVT